MDTWAAVRKSSSRQYLTDPRINFIELDFSSQEKMEEVLAGHAFDYVIHAAGVTKSLRQEDFMRVNYQGTCNLVNALMHMETPPRRFVYLSSLSIFGAIKERLPYVEIAESDTPKPNTLYGKSKLMAERFLESVAASFPYIILRPTGVYGPREHDYFMLVETVKKHLDISVGFKRQDITFIYVKDLVQAVFLSLDRGMNGRKYFLSDGNVYQASDFSQRIREGLGSPWKVSIKIPIWLLRMAAFVGQQAGRISGKATALNNDKYNILKQRNWRCDIEPAVDELGFHPHYDLKKGVAETMQWYKDNGWI